MKLKMRDGFNYAWKRDSQGDWVSDNGKWRIQRSGSRRWTLWVQDDGGWELWGWWMSGSRGKEYLPYPTLREAMAHAEDADFEADLGEAATETEQTPTVTKKGE